jgi:hypothetical protein
MSGGEAVLVVCHDAGSARALIPVARELARAGISVGALVAGPAAGFWRAECLEVDAESVADNIDVEALEVRLGRRPVDVVLTGAGLYNAIEHTARLAAARLGLGSVSVLDAWLNYADRFQRTAKSQVDVARPHRICVPDEIAYCGMLEAGFEAAQLIITGSPNLEASVAACDALSASARESARRRLGIGRDGLLVTFFSDPFTTGEHGETFGGPGGLVDDDRASRFGYVSAGMLDAVLDELGRACEAAGRSCVVIVKPHPLEHTAAVRGVAGHHGSSQLRVLVRADGPAARWIALSDCVMGMMSIALLEAALAGRPALSVQIGLLESGTEDPCVANALGYTHAIYTRDALRVAARRVVERDFAALRPRPHARMTVEGAARRAGAVVLEVALERRRASPVAAPRWETA